MTEATRQNRQQEWGQATRPQSESLLTGQGLREGVAARCRGSGSLQLRAEVKGLGDQN